MFRRFMHWLRGAAQVHPVALRILLIAAVCLIVGVTAGNPFSNGGNGTGSSANQRLLTATSELTSSLKHLNKAQLTCGGESCNSKLDRETAAAFGAFADKLAAIPMPASAKAQESRLSADAATLVRDYTKIDQVTGVGQSTSASSGINLQRDTSAFSKALKVLMNDLLGSG